MKLPRAAQVLLTIVLAAVTAGFGTSAKFYAESLSSAFFAIALISVVIMELRVSRRWPDGVAAVALTALFAFVDFRFLHYAPHLMAWFSFLGLSSLFLLASRAIWSEGARRKLFLLAFVPSLLFVTSEWFASNMLDLTEHLHPRTLDLFLYSFDGSLGVQISFLMGQAYALSPWFKVAGELFYVGLPIPIAVVYSGQLLRIQQRAIPAMAAFLLTGPIGILFYNIFPAMGPIHLVRGSFPWYPFSSDMFRRVLLEPVAIHGPRNAIPSLHMGWVLLTWWYSKGLSVVERGITILFVVFTVCATMGTGEHYLIDLVLAFPFAVFMMALCVWPPAWKQAKVLEALLFGVTTILVWFAALRYTPRIFWISPAIPWLLSAATVAASVWLKKRFDGVASEVISTAASPSSSVAPHA